MSLASVDGTRFFAPILIAMLSLSVIANGGALARQEAYAQGTENNIDPKVKLERSTRDVYSMQPVTIYAYYYNGGSDSQTQEEVKLRVAAEISAKSDRQGINLPKSSPIIAEMVMVPVGGAKSGWYIAQVPGLPSESFALASQQSAGSPPAAPPFQQPQNAAASSEAKMTIASSVKYDLIVDGNKKASGSYNVIEGRQANKKVPPLVSALVYDAIQDGSVREETQGLGPKGWTWPGKSEMKVLVVAADEKPDGIGQQVFEYSTNDGGWQKAELNPDHAMSDLDELTGAVNESISSIEDAIRKFKPDFDLPDSRPSIQIGYATIPGQPAGSYVKFKASATDVDRNKSTSPAGLYYTVNSNSKSATAAADKLLIVDPHVSLWLHQTNAVQYAGVVKSAVDSGIPEDLRNYYGAVAKTAKALDDRKLESFHHWEYLGQDYDFYIAYPKSNLSDMLKKPDAGWKAIILSNLWLGYSDSKDSLFNWDLAKLEVIDDISKYVKENHAGLIVTHGTLADWHVWTDCSKQQPVGARGNVGSSAQDVSLDNESTVAAHLGMPQLALFEEVRDKAAESLCSNQKTRAAGQAVGTMPLQIPYIQTTGKMAATKEAKAAGFNIPTEFTIATHKEFKKNSSNNKAFTQVGWQLGLAPDDAATVIQKVKESKQSGKTYKQITSFAATIIAGNSKTAGKMDKSISDSLGGGGMNSLYKSVALAAEKKDGKSQTSASVSIPPAAVKGNVTIPLDKGVYDKVVQLKPVRLVAVSDDGLAGIVAYDKYWDRQGYRSVYLSFEPEASDSNVAKPMMLELLKWSQGWSYSQPGTR